MNLKPIRGQVVVLPDPPTPPSAIILAPEAVMADNPNYFTESGRVIALADHSFTQDGEDECPFDVQVGDRVHFGRYAGKQVTAPDDGKIYLVMFEHEITGVLDAVTTVAHGYEAAREDDVQSYDRDPFADRA